MEVVMCNGERYECRRLVKFTYSHYMFSDTNLMIPIHQIKEINDDSEEEEGE